MEKVWRRPPDFWVLRRQMRKADIVIFLGKLTANFLENCAEYISLIVARGRFIHVADKGVINEEGKGVIWPWIPQLFQGLIKRSCVC
jgi:hypothetical protein